MNKKAIQNNNADKNVQDEMILAEMICREKEMKIFTGKEIVIEDIDALIFGEIDCDRLYHSEK